MIEILNYIFKFVGDFLLLLDNFIIFDDVSFLKIMIVIMIVGAIYKVVTLNTGGDSK